MNSQCHLAKYLMNVLDINGFVEGFFRMFILKFKRKQQPFFYWLAASFRFLYLYFLFRDYINEWL